MTMALSTATDWQNALYALLWAEDNARGGVFIDEWLRQGGLSDADMATIRTGYANYKKTRSNRPAFTPSHPDAAASIRTTDQQGRG